MYTVAYLYLPRFHVVLFSAVAQKGGIYVVLLVSCFLWKGAVAKPCGWICRRLVGQWRWRKITWTMLTIYENFKKYTFAKKNDVFFRKHIFRAKGRRFRFKYHINYFTDFLEFQSSFNDRFVWIYVVFYTTWISATIQVFFLNSCLPAFPAF